MLACITESVNLILDFGLKLSPTRDSELRNDKGLLHPVLPELAKLSRELGIPIKFRNFPEFLENGFTLNSEQKNEAMGIID